MDTEQLNAININALMSNVGVIAGDGGFNWWNLAGGLIFGTIGMVVFMYGKKERRAKPLCIGLVLMIYPYFIPNTLWMFIVGIALCAVLYFWRD